MFTSAVRLPRRSLLLVIGVLVVCVGALVSASLLTQGRARRQVVVVTRPVVRFHEFTRQDLRVIDVGDLGDIKVVSGSELDQLVGRRATNDLPEGSLIPTINLTDEVINTEFVRVAARLAPGHAPSTLTVGARLELVHVLDAAKTNALNAGPTPGPASPTVARQKGAAAYVGRLVTEPVRASDGTLDLELDVPRDYSDRIAIWAATGELAVIVAP